MAYPSPALALRLQVRARAEVDIEVFARGDRVVVRGRVRDARGRGIATAAMAVSFHPPTAGPVGPGVHGEVRSGPGGRFEWSWPRADAPLRDDRLRVRAVFAGSPSHGAAERDFITQVDRPALDLEVEVHPARVTTDLKQARIAVFVGLIGVPQSGRVVTVKLDGVVVASLQTAVDGWAETGLPIRRLLPVGVRRLEVSTPSTRYDNGRSRHVAIEVKYALRVALRVVTVGCAPGATCIAGEVRAHSGDGMTRPVADAVITLHAARHRLGVLRSGTDGRFAARLRADVLAELFAPGAVGVVAEVRVAAPYHEIGWSPVIAIDVPPPSSPSSWLYVGFLALIILGFVVRRLRDRRRERDLAEELEAVAAGLPIHQVRHVGSHLSGPSYAIRGVVLHGETGLPVAATVVVQPMSKLGDLSVDQQTTAQAIAPATGHFAWLDLAAGAWQLTVEVAEHQPLRLSIVIPHDGTYDDCELLPRSCRAVVRGLFSASVAHHTGRPVDWRKETPAQVEPRWMRGQRRGHAAIRDAVDATDGALYGRHTSPQVAQQVADALREIDQ